MQDNPTALAELAERASDTLRALLTEAEEEATRLTDELERTEPPPELYRAARVLERWKARLQDGAP